VHISFPSWLSPVEQPGLQHSMRFSYSISNLPTSGLPPLTSTHARTPTIPRSPPQPPPSRPNQPTPEHTPQQPMTHTLPTHSLSPSPMEPHRPFTSLSANSTASMATRSQAPRLLDLRRISDELDIPEHRPSPFSLAVSPFISLSFYVYT